MTSADDERLIGGRTKSAWPDHLARPPHETHGAWPLDVTIEWYRTQATAGQYRDFMAGLNAGARPDDSRQGRLL